jgi:4-carboxymuconolactone decarboxylase
VGTPPALPAIATAASLSINGRTTHARRPPDSSTTTDRRLRAEDGVTDRRGPLFGDIWSREELPRRDRSLITVAALITNGNTEQLRSHLALARENGLTETELKEAIVHIACDARWPRAMSAIAVAKDVFTH